jgi:hypothetical protein
MDEWIDIRKNDQRNKYITAGPNLKDDRIIFRTGDNTKGGNVSSWLPLLPLNDSDHQSKNTTSFRSHVHTFIRSHEAFFLSPPQLFTQQTKKSASVRENKVHGRFCPADFKAVQFVQRHPDLPVYG